jgi:septal ring factor EnvC (AmiA/AmiB activator)
MYMKKTVSFIAALFVLLGSIFPSVTIAQTSTQVCDDNFTGLSQDELRQKLAVCQAELAQQEAALSTQKKQSGTLKGDISVLQADISAKQTKINARLALIKKLGGEIDQKNQKIAVLSDRLENQKQSLAQLIRKTRELDNDSVVQLLLTTGSISDFYSDLDSVTSIKGELKESVDELHGIRSDTEEEKQSLEQKQDEETDAKIELEAARKKVEENKKTATTTSLYFSKQRKRISKTHCSTTSKSGGY